MWYEVTGKLLFYLNSSPINSYLINAYLINEY